MRGDRIEVGDTVVVQFVSGASIYGAEVLYIPVATGDSWILLGPTGVITYVQMFERMDLLEKAEESEEEELPF